MSYPFCHPFPWLAQRLPTLPPSDITKVVEQSVENIVRSEFVIGPTMNDISTLIATNVQGSPSILSAVPQLSPEEALKKEVDDLIEQGEYTQALSRALGGSNLPNLLRVLPRLKIEILSDLSQPVLLSLVQQLAFELSVDEHLKTKMEWLEQSVLYLETSSDVVAFHGAEILNIVSQNLCSAIAHMDQSTPDRRGESRALKSRMKLMLHVIQNLLADIRS